MAEPTAGWPGSVAELVAEQRALAAERPRRWHPTSDPLTAGCFAAFPRGHSGKGSAGDPAWAGAAAYRRRRCRARATTSGRAGWAYEPGLLAMRVGPVLEAVVRALPVRPDVLLVDATGRDHPRRCGLAVHLGAMLDIPTVGVTHRPLLATGAWPADRRGAASPLLLDGERVGAWLRTRQGRRPVAVHAGWRTDAYVAARVVLGSGRHRTPGPIREARRLARQARASTPR
ncbi:endonuclease V [Haloechinothrix sp. YIM 98757]|uniref:Endonuclease V n=1 Tax=Haloechinothrix aidingensis TaxID=2752311 RepID=A0A838AAT0_9PSEU|nr:endonuclease V [Haloechinothrix aidingensis]MBA0126344.1 endonuclease V [Haloechinothrix aidingensis]